MKIRIPMLALVTFVGMTSVNWSPEDFGVVPGDLAAVKGHGTVVAPVMDTSIPSGKNLLWCATFQMAWDSAGGQIGRPIRLQPGCKLADALNANRFDRRWVDDASVFTASGRVSDGVLDRINAGALAKTGETSKLLKPLRNASRPEDLVFYAALKKDLVFEKPFGKLGNWKVGGRRVPWFGFSPDQQGTGPLLSQARIHHYAAKNDFVIELISKNTGDQLLLAKLPATPETATDASRNVLKRLQAKPPEASANDLLAVPNVVAVELAEFSELQGRGVAGKELFLRSALQTIDFRMDEKGVKLASEAAVSFGCSAQVPIDPRLMILDPPFVLIMKRKNAPQPYFIAWFGNADLLGTR